MSDGGAWTCRAISLLVAAAFCGALTVAPATAAEDPASWMYSPRTISEINLTLPPASWQTLEEPSNDKYVRGTFSIAETNGLPGTAGAFTAPIEVGVKLKGGEFGSRRTLKQKAAFKVKFDKFVEGQTFLGLEKLTLNNMVEDPSMVHEAAAYDAFRALGVAAPRAGYAFLRVNGESFGLHLNLETPDKIWLEKQFGPFGPPQHLYEGEYGADVTPDQFGRLEVDEGDEEEKGDLKALTDAVSAPTPSFWAAVDPLADLDEMTRMWAVEKYIGHWDGYSGRAGAKQPNNYYLLSDPAGRFQMLPWGTDETWVQRLDFEEPGGVLFNDCAGDEGLCEETYRQALAATLSTLNALNLDDAVRCNAERLLPWQRLEADEKSQTYPERVPFSAGQIAAGVSSTREFIGDRPEELGSFLEASPPPAPAAQPCPPPTQRRDHEGPPAVDGTDTASPNALPPPAGAVVTPISVIGASIGRRVVRLRLLAPAAGEVVLRGWTGSGRKRANACAPARLAVAAAGATGISCKLTESARHRRAKRWLRLHLRVSFKSRDGLAQDVRRNVTLRRQ